MAHTDPHGAHGPAGLGHEPTDANLSSSTTIIVVTLVFLAAVFAAMWLMYVQFRSAAERSDTPPPPMAQRQGDRLPPEPRLLTNEPLNLDQFREAEEKVLRGYAWVDEQAGIARIPVARAIELVAERGLPAPAPLPGTGGAPAALPAGATAPGEAGAAAQVPPKQ